MRTLKIAYVSVDDPMDRRTWSGTNFHLAKALQEAGHELVPIGPLRPQPLLFLLRVFNQLLLRTAGKRFHYRDSFILSRAYARMLRKRIEGKGFDLIVAPAGLSVIALLRTEVPIIYINDRCLAGAMGYHAILRDLLPCSRAQSLELERRALGKATLSVLTSPWASDAAKKAAPGYADRVRTIPMGANLESVPEMDLERVAPSDPLTLLFVGVHWENKGGPTAVAALQELKRMGHRARLVVCGSDPPEEVTDADVLRRGFLDKNVPEERDQLAREFASADLFILPTKFEAYGIVFCEAAAFGLPAFGPRTGGVPSIIDHEVTGILLDPQASGATYAKSIDALIRDPERWSRMRHAARERFLEDFTWTAFASKLMSYFEEVSSVSNPR